MARPASDSLLSPRAFPVLRPALAGLLFLLLSTMPLRASMPAAIPVDAILVPNYNLAQEPALNPSSAAVLDSAHNGGINLLGANICPACSAVDDAGIPLGAQENVGLYLATGELFDTAVDLVIPGRGFDYRFERKYRSGITSNGLLGANWDFNYNRRLLLLNAENLALIHPGLPDLAANDLLLMDGYGRVDAYRRNDDGSYQSPTGYYTLLTKAEDGSFRERDAWGNRVLYSVPDSLGRSQMTALSDRDGDTMRFQYDEQGRLSVVLDTLGRAIDYHYNVEGRLASIEDFSGRQVSFGFDANADLISVTSPAVTGTPNGNDFPTGKTTNYGYEQGHPKAIDNHNLNAIYAPNEVASAGAPRVSVVYDAQDRVQDLTLGGTNATNVPAGGTLHYTYGSATTTVLDRNGNRNDYFFTPTGHISKMQEETNRNVRPSDPDFYEMQYKYNADGKLVDGVYPLGNEVKYLYDNANADPLQHGNLLTITQLPDPARGGDQSAIVTSYSYEPLYNQVHTIISARGNDSTYTPQNGGTATPERYTTTYTYDYQEDNDVAGLAAIVGVSQATLQARLSAAGIAMNLGDVNGDGKTNALHGDLLRAQSPSVHLLASSKMAAIEGGLLQPVVTLYRYNQFGQPIAIVDAEGNITTRQYHTARDPDGDGTANDPTGDSATGGYLKEENVDTASASGRDSGTNPSPVNIRRQYQYDVVGNVTALVDGRGIVTRYAVNQLNQIVQITRAAQHNAFAPQPPEPEALTDFQYLERLAYDANNNLVLSQVEDRGNTSHVGGNNGGTGTAFVDTNYAYDILDQLVQTTQEVSDTLTLTTRYRYDANGLNVLVVEPAGNADGMAYDERDLLYQHITGIHLPPASALMAPGDPVVYDARGGLPSTMTYHYDENGNLAESVDAQDTDHSTANNSQLGGDGDRTRYLYDGFDRQSSVIDAVGNQTVNQYDPEGNLVRVSNFGPVGGASPTADGPNTPALPVSDKGVMQSNKLVNSTLLAATETLYDELSRPIESDHLLFAKSGATVRPPDLQDGATDLGKGDLTPGDTAALPGVNGVTILGRVSSRNEYDRASRKSFIIEDDGDTTRFFYDGAARVIRRLDGEGNSVDSAYDDNGNLIETRATDKAQRAGVADEIFLITYFYDSLNRQDRQVDNLGQTLYTRYDSRGNQVATADAEGPASNNSFARRLFAKGAATVNTINNFGNVTLYNYDGLNRQVESDGLLTASGKGDGLHIGADLFGVKGATPALDLSQGGGDGKSTLRYSYDANSLLESLTDDNGNQTRYSYDILNRRVAEMKGLCVAPLLADRCDPPTTLHYEYDFDSNMIRVTDENGSVTSYNYDADNRLLGESIARGAGVAGTTASTFQYDGLGRLTRATDNNDPAGDGDDSQIAFAYDSVGRVTEEGQQIGKQPAQAISSSWRAENLRKSLTYPNDRQVGYTYDHLDRLQQVLAGGPLSSLFLPSLFNSNSRNAAQVVQKAVAQRAAAFAAPPLATYSYIGPDRVLERAYANGARLSYLNDAGTADVGYDGLGRIMQLRHLRSDNTLVVGFNYSYDRMNNKLTEDKLHNAANDESYTYDSLYRLTKFERPKPGAITPLQSQWTLDGIGNWSKVDGEGRRHSSLNEIIERNGASNIAIQSDNNGNTTDDGTLLYQWDANNRLIHVTRKADNKVIALYSYDALGRRTRKVVTNSGNLNGETDFYYDGWRVIEERNAAGVPLRQYVYGRDLDEVLAMDRNVDGDQSATGSADQRLFYHQNALGSVYALSDSAGKVAEGYQYDAYGRQTLFAPGGNGLVDFGSAAPQGSSSSLGNPYLFAGSRLDAETGLYFDRMRFLSPELGRFLGRDPLEYVDGVNLYAYVGDRPTNWIDPLGAEGETQEKLKAQREGGCYWEDEPIKQSSCKKVPGSESASSQQLLGAKFEAFVEVGDEFAETLKVSLKVGMGGFDVTAEVSAKAYLKAGLKLTFTFIPVATTTKWQETCEVNQVELCLKSASKSFRYLSYYTDCIRGKDPAPNDYYVWTRVWAPSGKKQTISRVYDRIRVNYELWVRDEQMVIDKKDPKTATFDKPVAHRFATIDAETLSKIHENIPKAATPASR